MDMWSTCNPIILSSTTKQFPGATPSTCQVHNSKFQHVKHLNFNLWRQNCWLYYLTFHLWWVGPNLLWQLDPFPDAVPQHPLPCTISNCMFTWLHLHLIIFQRGLECNFICYQTGRCTHLCSSSIDGWIRLLLVYIITCHWLDRMKPDMQLDERMKHMSSLINT